jgi:hypothetical protein
VVQIEATSEVLVRFATTRVLGDDDTRDRFEDFAGAQEGPFRKLVAADRALRSRIGDANQAVLPALHDEVW